MKQQNYLVAILVVSILSLVLSFASIIYTSSVANKVSDIDQLKTSIDRIDKTVVNPAYSDSSAEEIDKGSSIYMRLVTAENILYQICYGDPLYTLTNDVSFTGNQRCPAL